MNESPNSSDPPTPAGGSESTTPEPTTPAAPDQPSAPPPDVPPAAPPPSTAPSATPPPEWGPPPAAPGPAPGIEYGGFWIRFAAYVIDGLILGLLGLALGVTYGLVIGVTNVASGGSGISPGQNALLNVVSFLIGAVYFVGLWVRGGATLGQQLLGLQVVRNEDGGPITWGKAVIRYIGIIISTLVLFIGLIWVAFEQRKRGWHDLMAGTVVIRRPDVPLTTGRKVVMWGAIGCGCLLPILAILGITVLLFMGPIVQDIFGNVADDLARDSDGQITTPTSLTWNSLRAGDCFNLPADTSGGLVSVDAVPCDDAHVYEVFYVADMPDGAYPGEEAIAAFADDRCTPAFEEYVGVPFLESSWNATYVGPTEATWLEADRTVICPLFNASETEVTGSAEGSQQ